MPKTKISEWSSTPANNTDIDSINIAEGCAPSGINDAIRELMAQVKDLYSGTTGDAIGVAGGGTGQTSYTNGQLLIGNTTGNTLTKATLTAGTGVSITNGTGSITIAATGVGDVVGPASSTDNAFTRFDSTTGKLLQNSTGATLSDTGAAVFTGSVDIAGNSTAGSNIKLYEDTDNGTNYVAFKAPDTIAANVTWTLPAADGTSAQVLSTNGSGTLSWATASGGSSQWTTTGSDIYYNTGKVAIGRTSANVKLDVLSGTANTGGDTITDQTASITGADLAASTAAGILTVATNTTAAINTGGSIGFSGAWSGTAQAGYAVIKGAKETSATSYASYLAFYTRPDSAGMSERGRFSSAGFFKATNSGSYPDGSTVPSHYFTSSLSSNNTLAIRADSSSFAGASVLFLRGNRNTTDNTFRLIEANNGNDSGVFNVRDSGNVVNTNNSYGAYSDVKLKQDIVDASSQWDDIKNVRVRKFRYKNNPTGSLVLGVVAQELETVSAGLIESEQDYEDVQVPVFDSEGNPLLDENGNAQTEKQRNMLETTTKSVKYSVLYMKAVKALQEAMIRIEQLEARLDAANL